MGKQVYKVDTQAVRKIIILAGIIFFVHSNLVIFPISAKTVNTIHIAYTGNLNCYLESCNCGKPDLGSMVRLKNAVDSLRQEHPDLILLDSGDFLNTYPLEKANTVMWELMNLMDYDAIGLGDQEFVDGYEIFHQRQHDFFLPFIASNTSSVDKVTEWFPKIKMISIQNMKITILGVIFPESFEFIEKPPIQSIPVVQSLNQVLKEIPQDNNINILIAHASYRKVSSLIVDYPQISVFIAGHTQERIVKDFGKQILVQPGLDGEYLGHITVKTTDKEVNFHHQFYPIHKNYGEDDDFREKVDNYYQGLLN